MGLNPRQRRNRARFREKQALLAAAAEISARDQVVSESTQSADILAISRDDRPTSSHDRPACTRADQRCQATPGGGPIDCQHVPLSGTPKGRLPLPPPSSDSPRRLLKIRRNIRARFSRARKVLFPVAPGVDRAAAHSLGLDLTRSFEASTPEADVKGEQESSRTVLSNGRQERHRSRNYVLSKFFQDSRPYLRPKPAKDPRRNLDCPNISFYLLI